MRVLERGCMWEEDGISVLKIAHPAPCVATQISSPNATTPLTGPPRSSTLECESRAESDACLISA